MVKISTPVIAAMLAVSTITASVVIINRTADSGVVPTPEAPAIQVHAQSVAGQVVGEPSREGSSAGSGAGAGPWPNTEVVNQLRDVDANAASYRAAIAKALPVLATDQDVQLLVGDMLIGHGDPVNGLAWQLLACMHCTQTDERLGWGCTVEGLCDPNLALVDVFRRDYGEQMVADALARMEEIRAAIATKDPAALAPFTEVTDAQFPPVNH